MANNQQDDAKYQESFGHEITQNSKVHLNLSQEFMVITEDKFRLCLYQYVDRLIERQRWIAPVSLFITFLTVFATSTFHDFVLPASTWQAVFVICAFTSGAWSIWAVIKALRTDAKVDNLVNELKRKSENADHQEDTQGSV